MAGARTGSREAFGYFVRASAYGHVGTSDGDAQAEELYRLAIERDPQFALAYVGLAEVKLSTITSRELKVVDVSEEVVQLLATAEKLNPDMPELMTAKGWYAKERKAYDEAEQFLRRRSRATRAMRWSMAGWESCMRARPPSRGAGPIHAGCGTRSDVLHVSNVSLPDAAGSRAER